MDRTGKEPVDTNGKEAWGEIKGMRQGTHGKETWGVIKGMRQGTHKGKRPGVK